MKIKNGFIDRLFEENGRVNKKRSVSTTSLIKEPIKAGIVQCKP